LSASFESLSDAAILSELGPEVGRGLSRLEIHDEIDSTNQALLDDDAPIEGKLTVCLAEYQTAGRGRRGRTWVAPSGGCLCFSVGWLYDRVPRNVTALALAAGVVIRRALYEATGVTAQLKWPNDLVVEEKKLGGVLVELRSHSRGACYVVIGVGINVSSEPAELKKIAGWSNGAIDLVTATGGRPPSRNVLAAKSIQELSLLLPCYRDSGFSAYHAEFLGFDYLRGRQVSVDNASPPVSGIAAGVDETGALLVDSGHHVERVVAGDVSVRIVG